MNSESTKDLLSRMDECIDELVSVMCWRCENAKAEPSVCPKCRVELGGYARPPKGTKRIPWLGDEG